MKTAIRLDDITMNMDWERFLTVKAILDEAGIKPLIGVVPFPEDDNLNRMGSDSDIGTYIPKDKWSEEVRSVIPADEKAWEDYLKALKDDGWVIALHGFNHVYTTDKGGLFPLNRFSEFAGVPYFTQLNMLKNGLKKLADMGLETDMFMAPGHTYDMNTLKALCACGIKKVTDGFGSRPYRRIVRNAGRAEALSFYPISRRRKECTADGYGFTTHVLHCNTMTDADMEELKAFIKNNRSHFIDYSEYVTEPPADRGFWGNLIEHMTARAKYRLVKIRAALGDILKGDDSTSIMDDTEDVEEEDVKAVVEEVTEPDVVETEKPKDKKKDDDIEYFDEEDNEEDFSSWLG